MSYLSSVVGMLNLSEAAEIAFGYRRESQRLAMRGYQITCHDQLVALLCGWDTAGSKRATFGVGSCSIAASQATTYFDSPEAAIGKGIFWPHP